MQSMQAAEAVAQPRPQGVDPARFRPADRPALTAFAAQSTRFAQLLHVFPAAALVLARREAPFEFHARALSLVREGAALARVADALGLPMWLKRVPPEGLHGPLKGLIGLGRDAVFGRMIANAMPLSLAAGSTWLPVILEARRACHDRFAAWFARETLHEPDARQAEGAVVLTAWAFYSCRPGSWGHRLIERSWTPHATLLSAASDARAWIERAILDAQARRHARLPRWSPVKRMWGFDFVPLETRDQIADEARVMRHCVLNHAGYVARGESRLFSVRLAGARVATIEVEASASPRAEPLVVQRSARFNTPPAPNVLWAVEDWTASRATRSAFSLPVEEWTRPDHETWRALWTPWRDHAGDIALNLIPLEAPETPADLLDAFDAFLEAAGVLD
jgi:hypothetical protein